MGSKMRTDSKFRWLAVGLFGLLSGACSSKDSGSGGPGAPTSCTPGAQVQCGCADGTTSLQQCGADGATLTACACEGAGGPASGGAFSGAGGAFNPGAGGTVNPGAGGTVNPGAGGTVNPGAGGTVDPGAGGTVDPGAGGTVDPGAGGTVDPGTGGTTGGVTLEHCDMTTETGNTPITWACGDLTTPTGSHLPLGSYGAVMDSNVGAGFENAVASSDVPGSATCPGFAAIFGEDPALTNQLLDTGDLNFALYTVYRPANWPEGKIPIISWGNGTCAQPEGYGALLRYVASQGFFIVAANSRQVGSGTEIRHGLDFAAAANDDPASPYYQHLDTSKMGVMGHSQGSQGATAAATDSRVKAAILFNLGLSASKTFLAISGDLDITGYNAGQMAGAVNGAPKGAYLYYHNPAGMGGIRGHLVLMLSPERVTEPTANWWKMLFLDDATARDYFVGSSCGLCNHAADFDYGQHGL